MSTKSELETAKRAWHRLLNKEVGTEVGISEITVKVHRGSVMRKMKADSFAHLVNMASRLRVGSPFVCKCREGARGNMLIGVLTRMIYKASAEARL